MSAASPFSPEESLLSITDGCPFDRLPPLEPDQCVAGIDWAKDDHAVAVVDAAGRTVERFTVAHTRAGLRELLRRLGRLHVGEVAIERPDGQVVEALLEAETTVVVISPNQLKNLRSRYGQAGNKDDRFDAFVLADTLRTDRQRLRRLTPDNPATVTLRATVRARKDLVNHRVALCNQLRAHLQAFYPAPVGLFHELDGLMSLKFLGRFDCQDRADWLTPKRLAAFLAGIRYCGATTAEAMHARISAAAPGATGDTSAAAVHVTRALVAALQGLIAQIDVLTDQITEQLHAHVDGHIFRSLPRTQALRCGPAGCWPRSGTRGAGSPPRRRLRRWPGSRPRRGSRARAGWSGSVGPWTGNCATPWWSGPGTPGYPVRGRPTSTGGPGRAVTTIRTRCGCWPGLGCM